MPQQLCSWGAVGLRPSDSSSQLSCCQVELQHLADAEADDKMHHVSCIKVLLFLCLRWSCSQRRCSVLQWNPDVATQLVVASEDDRTPTLQMWDLRNSMSPVKEFVGHVKVRACHRGSCSTGGQVGSASRGPSAGWEHTAGSPLYMAPGIPSSDPQEGRLMCAATLTSRCNIACVAVAVLPCVVLFQGVMGMSWCPQDHSLLLSCSKDHRTICWDVSTTDIVCEMPTQDSWSFDVQVG
jgi:WD40 repeat protein